jgi:hypothetical protein
MNLKDELKKGQAFIGLDDNKYYFLGYDYDNQIFFTNLDLWSDKEQSYMTKSNIFIKEVLDEKSKIIEDSTWYYQSMKELDNSTMEEKIKRCLDIIKNSNSKDFELRPTEIGPLVRGQAYSKEFNQYYEVIGFVVENNIYVDKDLKTNQKGFFAIYHSNCESTVPLIFERNYSDRDNNFDGKHFVAGNDDRVDIEDIIYNKELVNSYMDANLIERLENTNKGITK